MRSLIKKYKKPIALSFLVFVMLFGFFTVFANNGACEEEDIFCLRNPLRFETIGELFEEVTTLLIALGLSLVVLMIVLGGFYIMISGGKPELLEKGKNIIKWTIIGVLLLIFSRAVLAVIEAIVGG